MTTSEFYNGLEKYMANTEHVIRHWRRGQAVFNYAATVDERVADKLRGSECDPFHMDSLIERFVDEFCKRCDNMSVEAKYYKLVDKLREWCTKNDSSNSWLDDWDAGYECARLSSMHDIKAILKEIGVEL